MLNDYTLFKIVVIGDEYVGKSSVIQRLCTDKFRTNSSPTIGIDFAIKPMYIGEQCIKLQIWDTAGQERYRAVTQSYYRSADLIVVCYDITNENSFNNVIKWVYDCKKLTRTDRQVPMCLVGTKADLHEERKVKKEDGQKTCKQHGFTHFEECSASTGHTIHELFRVMGEYLYTQNNIDIYTSSTLNSPLPFRLKPQTKPASCNSCAL
jgi:small GTP-binding protein